jgi:hypothetical protein
MEYRQRRQPQAPPTQKRRVFISTETEEAARHTIGSAAGLHPEDLPQMTTSEMRQQLGAKQTQRPPVADDEWEVGSRIASVARRYTGIPMPDGVVYRQGNEQLYLHNGPPPVQRASKMRAQTTREVPVARKPRRRWHWLVWVGLSVFGMLLSWVLVNGLGSWWQNQTATWAYGYPRTYQTDAVVGHGDSAAHPSHFLALNLNRHVLIVEFPGGDVSRSVIYTGPTLMGDGQDGTPVTLTFSDVNRDGGLDMLVHIQDQTLVFLNNGTKFVPPSNTVVEEGIAPLLLGGA